jgi:hypothetical protein
MRPNIPVRFPVAEPKRQIFARVFLRAPQGYVAWVLSWTPPVAR